MIDIFNDVIKSNDMIVGGINESLIQIEIVILNLILINKDINLKIDIQVSIKFFNCYYKKCYKMIVF